MAGRQRIDMLKNQSVTSESLTINNFFETLNPGFHKNPRRALVVLRGLMWKSAFDVSKKWLIGYASYATN